MFGMMFTKRHPQVGSRPGTLVIPAEAPPPQIHLISFAPNHLHEADITDVEELREAFDEKNITWVDIQGFGDYSLLHQVGEIFQLHPLLLEDVVNVPHRPKAEAYQDQLLVIVRMVSTDEVQQFHTEQFSVVLGKGYVLTFQERPGDVLDPVRKRIREGVGRLYKHGADYLAYAIIDTIVDAYYPVLEVIGEHLEALEDEVIRQPTPELLATLNRLKNRLVNLRRGIWPQREAVNSMVRGDFPHVTEDVRIYLRDTHDHCVQTSEVAEMYREMASGLMNTYLSSIANRTNEVMKVLTIVATIFIPLTFLAGIYGMNFSYMPELQVWWAYPIIWLTMLMVAGGMTWFFWRKGWIGQQSFFSSDDDDE